MNMFFGNRYISDRFGSVYFEGFLEGGGEVLGAFLRQLDVPDLAVVVRQQLQVLHAGIIPIPAYGVLNHRQN